MKKGIFYMLLIALILSYLDGVLTYVWITNGYAYEIGPFNLIAHKLIRLDMWLIGHAVLGTIIATIIMLGKYEKVVKCWLIIEVILTCLHLITLRTLFL